MSAKYIVVTDLGCNIPVEVMRFPSGEVAVKITPPTQPNGFRIKNCVSVMVQGYEPDTLFILANIKDAIDSELRRGAISAQVRLFLGYMPNARYDRHMVDGDGFALRVFCDMLNLLKFDQILVVDPHSDATTTLLRNARPVDQYVIMNDIIADNDIQFDVLIAPDAGAHKKIFKLAHMVQKPVVTMAKVRDLATGNITHTELLGAIRPGARCLIVDDLCDGGRTFIEAAKALLAAGAAQVDLAVTHGIFSQGVEHLLTNGINNVYTTDSYGNLEPETTGRVFEFKFF